MLTIDGQTKKIRTWINDDPVALHRTITEYEIRIENDDFRVLINRLQQKHFEYYRDFMRLNIDINYPNDETLVRASIPYKESPVKFYKWWRKNQSKVTMNFEERVKLFLTVDRLDSKALIKAHKELIQKKK